MVSIWVLYFTHHTTGFARQVHSRNIIQLKKTMLHYKLCIIILTPVLIFWINTNRALLFPYCFTSAADAGHSIPSNWMQSFDQLGLFVVLLFLLKSMTNIQNSAEALWRKSAVCRRGCERLEIFAVLCFLLKSMINIYIFC